MRTFLRGKVTLLFMVLGLLLAIPAVALADNVVNDVAVDTNGDKIVTVEAGGSAAQVGYKVVATGGDSQPSCNVTDGSSAKVTFTGLPTGATATPNDLTFTTCGDEQQVNFAAGAATPPGDYTIGVNVADSGTGTYNTNPAQFTLRVTAAADTTPPATPTLDLATASDSGSSNSDDVTNDNTPTFEGYAEAGSTVKIYDGSVAAANLLGSATANGATDPNNSANKAWTFTVASANALSDAVHTIHATATDAANNTSTQAASLSVRIDTVNPVVTFGSDITDGGEYDFGSVPDNPGCTATDTGGSGVTAAGCAVTGYSTAVGNHTLTGSATDVAGNPGEATLSYTVRSWTMTGFYQPVDMNGVYNTVKSGSTVPLKFEVFKGPSTNLTELTDTLSTIGGNSDVKVSTSTCEASAAFDEVETTVSGNTVLPYDTTSGQFVFNWQTPKNKAGSCYKVTIPTKDGVSSLTAYFKLK
jgi:hypothetical protein